MDTLNLIFGIVTIIAFIFSIYTYFKNESKKQIEIAKNSMIQERLKSLEKSLIKAFHTADMIVQIPKKRETDIEEIQNLGRLLRTDIKLTIDYLKDQEQQLEKWKYGKMIPSNGNPIIKNIPRAKL